MNKTPAEASQDLRNSRQQSDHIQRVQSNNENNVETHQETTNRSPELQSNKSQKENSLGSDRLASGEEIIAKTIDSP